MLTGIYAVEAAVRSLWHENIKVVAITHGAMGAEMFTTDMGVSVRGYAVQAIDTVGSGDAFMAVLLAEMLKRDGHGISRMDLQSIAWRACAASALVATKPAATNSLPSAEEIEKFVARETPRPP
jgi:fructokinase